MKSSPDVGIEIDRFNTTENPVYAFMAYRRARANGETVPDEVLNYLDRALFNLTLVAVDPPKKREHSFSAIAKALSLTQKRLTDYKKDMNNRKFVRALEESYFEWIEENGTKHGWRLSILNVEGDGLAKKYGVSESTAKLLLDKFIKNNRKATDINYKKYLNAAKFRW